MASAGKSLVGFMDERTAISYLRKSCVCRSVRDDDLRAEWARAKAQLGAPYPNAGHPVMEQLDGEGAVHVQALLDEPWAKKELRALHDYEFRLVEIDRLLAMQFAVDVNRAQHHSAALGDPPRMSELLPFCLPLRVPPEDVKLVENSHSVLLTSRSLNVQSLAAGMAQVTTHEGVEEVYVGIRLGSALPLLHVVEFNGRQYLHNGFHRAYGASLRGAKKLPCLWRRVTTAEEAGIYTRGQSEPFTFAVDVLESRNPPTLAHFTQGRAYDVQLRAMTRTLHVSWAEYRDYSE